MKHRSLKLKRIQASQKYKKLKKKIFDGMKYHKGTKVLYNLKELPYDDKHVIIKCEVSQAYI